MLVMKFGGTSLANGELVERAAGIALGVEEPVALVVSAMGRTTDELLALVDLAETGERDEVTARLERLRREHLEAAAEPVVAEPIFQILSELSSILEGIRLLREQTPRSRAVISSVGERLSAQVVASHLRKAGGAAEAIDARQLVVTDERFEEATVRWATTREAIRARLPELLEGGTIPVVTGFIAATESGITTTLGRGGSDYSAALFGAALEAREIWIWTDVAGILTADPRLVREARTLDQVSYREAAEMSFFGARVLHPKTIRPAVEAGIPLRIKNSFEPESAGTLIAETAPTLDQGVKTVSSMHGLALVTIAGRGLAGVPGVARRVFEATEGAGVNVVMISQASSEQNISVVIAERDVARLVEALERAFSLERAAGLVEEVSAEPEVVALSIVGQGMAGTPGISGRLFGTLGAVGVNVLAIAQGASELNISVAVKEVEARRAVRATHSAFGLTRITNLMVLGCGRVGRTFLDQLAQTRASLESEHGLELRLVGLANSRHLLLDDAGLDPIGCAELLEGVERPLPGSDELVRHLQELMVTDLVLVDLTAGDTAEVHRACLEAGIHVVTANKRPLSGGLADHRALRDASRRTGAAMNYETTFGAGLPVLHTLQELLHTGDRILSIQGCFSGTLGYVSTRLEQGTGLAEAIEEARQRGLTEPDPREDLSGRDVARKALIIARTLGLEIEPDEVSLEPMVPGLDQGLERALVEQGPEIERWVEQERSQGRVLRYVAEIGDGRVAVGLRPFDQKHPLGDLRGEDNMLVFRTLRYDEHPLVIRGPGAGTEVTAAGVLGDVLKLVRRR